MKWQRTLTKSEDKDFSFETSNSGISVNGAGDVYLIGNTRGIRTKGTFGERSFSAYPESLFIAKYNTSGTLQWQRTLTGELGDDYQFSDLALDSSDNAYLFGSAKSSQYQTATDHKFGESVATGNGKVAIGCPGNQIGDGTRPGAVYLYDVNGTSISNEVKITPPSGAAKDFGGQVNIDSGKLIVNSKSYTSAENTQIYVYNLDGTLETIFTPNNLVNESLVAVGSNRIAVAHTEDGTVEIYDFSGNLETTIVTPLKKVMENYLGSQVYAKTHQPISSIAVGEGKVVLGSHKSFGAGSGDDHQSTNRLYGRPENGIVYVYNLDGTGETIITPSDIELKTTTLEYRHGFRKYSIDVIWDDLPLDIQKRFGFNVAIGDGKIAVQAPGEIMFYRRYHRGRWVRLYDPKSETPAVYLYDLDGTNERKIEQINPDVHKDLSDKFLRQQGGSAFGSSMSITNGKLIIGAGGEDIPAPRYASDPDKVDLNYITRYYTMNSDSGSVYIYDLDGTNVKRLKNSSYALGIYQEEDHGRYFRYGNSIAVADGTLIVGAPGMQLESLKEYGLDPGLAFAYDMNEFETTSMDSSSGQMRFMTASGETQISASDHFPTGTTQKDALLVKYNSSGSLQWFRKYDNGSTEYPLARREDIGAAMAVDNSDNVYTIIAQPYTGKHFLLKQDGSGSILWQRSFQLQYTGYQGSTHIIGEESQAAVTYADAMENPSNYYYDKDFKDKKITDAARMEIQERFLTVDSSGNIIIALQLDAQDSKNYKYHRSIVNAKIAIIKYNASGNVLWTRCIGDGVGGTNMTGEEKVTGVKTDPAGNIYICGSSASFGPDFDPYYLTDVITWDSNPKRLRETNDPHSAFIAKLPPDGSLTGVYGGLPYNEFITAPFGDANDYVQVSTNLSESAITDVPEQFVHAEGQMESSRSYLIDDSSTEFKSVKVSISAPTAEVFGVSGNTVTLANSSGTWSVGDNLHAEHQMSVVSTIDADDPSTLVLVASAPTATRGSINWGLAEWQLAEDHEFTRNLQVITKPLTESGAQTGPSEFTLDKSPRPYYVRVRYLSDDQADVFSEWSETNTFRTT